jgi:hypothetical protein
LPYFETEKGRGVKGVCGQDYDQPFKEGYGQKHKEGG